MVWIRSDTHTSFTIEEFRRSTPIHFISRNVFVKHANGRDACTRTTHSEIQRLHFRHTWACIRRIKNQYIWKLFLLWVKQTQHLRKKRHCLVCMTSVRQMAEIQLLKMTSTEKCHMLSVEENSQTLSLQFTTLTLAAIYLISIVHSTYLTEVLLRPTLLRRLKSTPQHIPSAAAEGQRATDGLAWKQSCSETCSVELAEFIVHPQPCGCRRGIFISHCIFS